MASIYKLGTQWRAQVRLQGQRSRSKVFKTKAEATRWAREQEAPGNTDVGGGGRAHTVGSMIRHYQANHLTIPAFHARQFPLIDYYIGHMRLAEITSASVIQFVKTRLTERSPLHPQAGKVAAPNGVTVQLDLLVLRAVLKYGWAVLESHDADKALQAFDRAVAALRQSRLLMSSTQRDRRPTDDELRALEEYFVERPLRLPIMDIVLFALCTCLRQGEICGPGGVVWEDLDAAGRMLWVRGRKDPTLIAGRDMQIPLLKGPVVYRGAVVDVIEVLRRQPGFGGRGRIFPWPENTVSAAFRRGVAACGIEDLRFHDLRHDGVSRLFEAGLDIPSVAAVSGHRSWRNLQRYTHIKPSEILMKYSR